MSSSGRHILAAYACIMRRTRHCRGSRGTYPVLRKIMQLRHPHPRWYLVLAPFTCSHTYNLFSLLNFADLSCDCEEFSAVKGLRSARWIWSRDSDKEAGWLSSSSVSLTGYSPPSSWAGNTFTLHPTPQKNQICWFSLFIHHITVWECCWAGITYVSFVWIALLKRAEMNLKKLSQPDRVFSASFLILLMLVQNPFHKRASSKTS